MYNTIRQTITNGKSKIQEINAGSMADIAFLLLIFFLVTTTLSTDSGILRKLPPITDVPPATVHKRNVMQIWINRENNLMVRGEATGLNELRNTVKDFIRNTENAENLPEIENIQVEYLGLSEVSQKHIISLMSDRGTKYSVYIAVQDEIIAAYSELRNDLAQKNFNLNYDELDAKRKKSVEKVFPMHISEAEPNIR